VAGPWPSGASEQRVVSAVGGLDVLPVRAVLPDGDDRGVLQLPGEGVGDRALVGRGRGEADVGQVVAVGQVRQDEGRIDHGGHPGQRERCACGGDDSGHGLGFDGVPEFHDGKSVPVLPCEPQQFGDLVTEGQLRHLFGKGRHPHADRIGAGRLAAGKKSSAARRGGALGRRTEGHRLRPDAPPAAARSAPRSGGRRLSASAAVHCTGGSVREYQQQLLTSSSCGRARL